MTQKERMLAGLPYKAWMDGLPEERARAQRACWEFNRLPPDARAERTALLRGLFGRTGEHLHIEEPFHCDLGYNIEVGEWFYANYNCVILVYWMRNPTTYRLSVGGTFFPVKT